MKQNILIQKCTAVNHYLTTRLLRFDPLSLVSRQSVLPILVACLTVFGVGNAWGDEHVTLYWSSDDDTSTQKNFTATSGSVTGVLSFSSSANSGSTPAYNSNNEQLRLYYGSNGNGNGGSVTITAADGVTFTSFEIGSATQPTTKYTVSGGSATAISFTQTTDDYFDNLYYGGADVSTTSIKIQNCNTTNTQLQIYYIYLEYTVASCSADPSTANASINGSFTLTSLTDAVTVSSGTWGTGSANCSWIDYGFVWGTTSSPTVSNNKVQVGTSGKGTSWSTDATHKVQPSGSTNPTSWSVGTTYYVKAYGKNGKDGAAFAYSTTAAYFTLRSIDFEENGGSTVNTIYANSGGTATKPSDPTKTGYTFGGWYKEVGLSNAVTWASDAISENKTYYAKWSAKTYAITLNGNGGTGSSPVSVNATYNAHALSAAITNPEKTDYIFEGWNTKADGSGLTIIGTNGELISSVSGYTDASGNWTKDGTETLYAKWTEHTYTNYRTSCCTELGTIDGEASLTQAGNSVTISGWSDVSNVGTYTVKLYKKNGASWDLVSGSTSGGSAGTQGTRTGITSGSKSVTYTGLEVESEYKFTVQAVAGSSAYCDGAETAVTEINDIDVSSTPFKFRYAIYIDDGTNDNYDYYYIEPTGNTDEGSVDIDLTAHITSYQFKIAGGFSGWWGQTGTSNIPASTKWTLNGSNNVKLNTGAGGTYTFTVDYSGTTNPSVTVTFPSADQDAGYVIYYDNSVLNWSNLYYRVGNNSSCSKVDVSLVPGTDKFYKVTTPDFDNMDAWHIANNYGWTGSNSIYRTKTSSEPAESPKAITNSISFQQYAVTEDITVIPTSTHSTGGDTGDGGNSNCEFYTINTPTSGMLTHNAAITSYSHGTVTVAYTNTSGSAASFTSGDEDLAHRCVLTITATPATGYSLSSLQVNSSNFTSGNEHILAADATITAVFTAQTSTVTLDNNSATSGSQQTVSATYDASMPLVTTADGTPAVVAVSRTGYDFNGWWDATSDGKQYYSYTSSTIASANNWDKTGTQTLYAQWIAKEYTITLDREGAASGAESVTATYDAGTLAGWSAPTKTGYRFDGYYSGDNGTGTLVISSTGVLQNSVTISAVNWTDASGHWIKEGGATVYAKWTANEYTISYKDQGDVAYSGSNSALLPTTHTYGAATDLVDGVKSGYRFDGWFDNSSCTGSAITSIGSTAITANTTYYAKWTEVYTVTWHVNGAEYSTGVVTGNSQVPDGEKISDVPTAPADNTLNNCANKFMGWSSKDAGSTAKTTSYYDDLFTDVEGSPTISDDIDFYAVFAERDGAAVNTVMWSENWTGATSGTTPTSPTASGSTVYSDATITYTWTPATGSSTGNTYLDANDYAGGSSPEAQIGKGNTTAGKLTISGIPSAGATKLTVSYKQNAQSLTASVSGPGYSGSKTSSTKAENSFDVTVGSASTFSLIFTGGSSNNVRLDNIVVKVKTVSYSNYVTECAANQVRVSYDFNGGYGSACTEGVTTKTASYTVCSTTPTKDYYDFAGWNDGTSTYNAGSTGYNLASSTTFTAQWTPTTYDITYELDGGTNDGDNPATYNVTTETITLKAPTRDHDRFDGWFTDDGVWSDEVTEIPLGSHGDITLYAKWSERHEIVFDYSEGDGGTTTTIYRADDENLEDAVAGMGSVPDDPDAPSTCSSKTFVGWVESEIDDETDTRPGDLMKSAAGTVDEDKHYYAVWATVTPTDPPVTYAGTGVFEEITSMGDLETGTYYVLYGYDGESTHGALKNAGSGTAGEEAGTNMTVSTSSITNPSTDIVWKLGGTTDAYTLYNQSASKYIEITTDDAKGFALNASATTSYKVTVEDGHGFFFKTNKTGCTRGISIYTSTSFRCYALASAKNLRLFKLPTNTVTAYCTSCCATKVTLSQNSPEHGTIVFGKTSVGTCGGDKEVSLAITPAAGYQLHSYEVATGSGKVAAKSVSPAISLDNNNSAAQNITLTFAEDANGAYDVTASFTEMVASAWTWTKHVGGATITTDPVEVYVGQKVQVDVAYEPAGLLSNHTNASAYNYSPSPWSNPNLGSPAKAGDHLTVTGTNAGSTSVVLNHNDGLTKTINYTVLALPLVHFVDNIHGETFANVVATVSGDQWTVTTTLPTPTHSDVSDPGVSYNTCERQHLHLLGWIESTWADAHPNAEPGDITGAGAGNYYAAGADIDLVTQNNKTFYAVWTKIE